MSVENIQSDILDIEQPAFVDESLDSFEYREYEAQNPAAINNGQAIQIDIHAQDIYTLPSKSYLLVEGQLESNTNTAYTDASVVSLINNGIMYLWSQIKYLINNNEIENLSNPGPATTMKGLASYNSSNPEGLNFCWCVDTGTGTAALDTNAGFKARHNQIIAKSVPVGTFSFCIPLAHMFGFCGDYKKLLYGVKQSIMLSGKNDADAIIRTGGEEGKIVLSKISWQMPHIMPSLESKAALAKRIEQRIKIPVSFRALQCDSQVVPQSTSFSWRLTVKSGSEKPRWIILGFQTAKSGSQLQNPATFNNVGVRNVYAMLNSDRYPVVDLALNFAQHKISRAYKALDDFQKEYYGSQGSIAFTPSDFIELYPLFVIDIRRQSERLKTAVQDIQIKADFSANVPANTTVYALLISDRLLFLQSSGDKFDLIY